ncbi:hypothetical protein Pmani_008223 [Petrolisthes manimaculis]|uniref:MAP3K HisK-N-like globin domain-containing protein n=1 Tax=Petrolisthes manimaculis TaxID=1843537 RepID=A0AAE1Q641_9EUCA|nr:hypothetical protein Pmani_008223 [Petrolisthes manimaculis]
MLLSLGWWNAVAEGGGGKPVNEVLKSHNIKPHWMFALDNLVRSAVHCAITVLSPEHEILLGPDAGGMLGGGGGRDVVEEGSTSGVSTINSTKSARVLHDFHHSKHCHQLQESLQATRADNLRLLEELYLSERRYGDLLRMFLNERREQNNHLASQMGISSLLPHISTTTNNINKRLCRESSVGAEAKCDEKKDAEGSSGGEQVAGVRPHVQCGAGGREGLMEDSPPGTQGSGSSGDTITVENTSEGATASAPPVMVVDPPTIHVSSRNIDMELVQWLQSLSLDREDIDKFLAEDYTKDDVLSWMTRDDLRKMKMRGGVELRIWRSVIQHRHALGLPINPEEVSVSTNSSSQGTLSSQPRHPIQPTQTPQSTKPTQAIQPTQSTQTSSSSSSLPAATHSRSSTATVSATPPPLHPKPPRASTMAALKSQTPLKPRTSKS